MIGLQQPVPSAHAVVHKEDPTTKVIPEDVNGCRFWLPFVAGLLISCPLEGEEHVVFAYAGDSACGKFAHESAGLTDPPLIAAEDGHAESIMKYYLGPLSQHCDEAIGLGIGPIDYAPLHSWAGVVDEKDEAVRGHV